MSTLRSHAAKLALSNPDLRDGLVPLLRSAADEEGEGGEGKMASSRLRSLTAKLALDNPDLRDGLVPLLKQGGILGPASDEALDDKLRSMTMLPNNERHPNWIFAHGGGLAGWLSKDDLRKAARRGDMVYFYGAPGGNAKILGWITPQKAKSLVRSLRLAADESDTDARHEKGKSIPLSALPGDLQQNAKNPPPKAKALKEKMQAKKSSLDRHTLDQLVDMAAESMELELNKAKATAETVRAADKFSRAVSQSLAVWVQK